MLLLFPAKHKRSGLAMAGLIAGYVAAKPLEAFDRQIGTLIATGGHPWKHIAAVTGIWWYVRNARR
jgi:hypothetical protein